MKLSNCEDCGVVIIENASRLCPACIRNEELAEDKVAEYLREVTRATMDEVAKATGVKHKVIMKMIKRGRISSSVQVSYPCETCGAPIYGGRVCDGCAKNITDQLRSDPWLPAPKANETKKDEKMYIRDMLQKKP